MTTTIHNLIGGEEILARSGDWIEDRGPATGEIIARIPRSQGVDVADAVAAAKAALPAWSKTQSHCPVEAGRA